MAKKLKEFDVVLVVRVKATSAFHAEGIGEGLVDHIFETFNDDGSVTASYVMKVEPIPQD